jgi:hypothetical protein
LWLTPNERAKVRATGVKGSSMSNRQRSQGPRIRIDFEAEALISNAGVDAYWVARQRAEEASSDEIARDWSGVAAAIARRAGKRPASFLGMFQ